MTRACVIHLHSDPELRFEAQHWGSPEQAEQFGQQLSLERSLIVWATEVEAEGQKWAFLEGLTGADTS